MKSTVIAVLLVLTSFQIHAGESPTAKGARLTSLIHDIQGTADTNLLNGEIVLIDAIVVGDFQDGDADTSRNLRGFYVQEEDSDADADALSSEGIFVFEGGNFIEDVNVGDRVQVTGTVSDLDGETRLDNVLNITVMSQGNTLPTAATISLMPDGSTSLSAGGAVQPDLEAFEGMRVTFADTLTISELFQLVRFNEIRLSQGGRLEQFTQSNLPDATGLTNHLLNIGSRTITYDDGLDLSNALIGNLDGFGPTFSTATDLRTGDTINNLSGVLSYQWGGNSASPATWRVRATQDGENVFDKVNDRQLAPDAVGGSLKVTSFNVLNYFTTLRVNGLTAAGASPRGANDATEFTRQTEKLITALTAIDADILGLIELENDFLAGASGNAIENLVAELNAISGAGTYAWIDPGSQFVGVDAISNGLIYKPAVVSVVAMDILIFQQESATTTFAIADVLNPFVGVADQVFNNQRNRPAIAATFEDMAGQRLTVAVNHFKAKSDSNLQDLAMEAQTLLDGGATGFSQADIDNLLADPNYDQADGQSYWNAVRMNAASELLQWLSDASASGYASGVISDPDILIVGDLNAYALEGPVTVLEAQGYVDLAAALTTDPRSFVFGGQSGTLDYALASPSLRAQVADATVWNINADEPNALDYNTDFNRDVTIFDGSLPFRASDHDPIVVGVSLTDLPVEIFSSGFEGD